MLSALFFILRIVWLLELFCTFILILVLFFLFLEKTQLVSSRILREANGWAWTLCSAMGKVSGWGPCLGWLQAVCCSWAGQ